MFAAFSEQEREVERPVGVAALLGAAVGGFGGRGLTLVFEQDPEVGGGGGGPSRSARS